jgi:L,D-peptidoglycan transpeptidase YkuD (ErfK/YbiS/YcfS/YnhG family)
VRRQGALWGGQLGADGAQGGEQDADGKANRCSRKAAVSSRPQRPRRGRLLAGRGAAHVAVLALASGVVLGAVPAHGQLVPATRTLPHHVRAAPAVAPQLVTVTARSHSATVAVAQRWERRDGRWRRVGRAMRAYVGAAGITRHPSESRPATPAGSFTLTQAFGAPSNAGDRITRLPYLRLHFGSAWGSDPGKRRTYNRYYDCHCASDGLYRFRYSYFRYGLVIDYNRRPIVPGAGSGFFVHVTDGHPTDGCVGLGGRDVHALLAWLRPAAHPRILIRVAARG